MVLVVEQGVQVYLKTVHRELKLSSHLIDKPGMGIIGYFNKLKQAGIGLLGSLNTTTPSCNLTFKLEGSMGLFLVNTE